MDKVAQRLAKESLNRQVVIFIHDIALLVLLEDACRKAHDRHEISIGHRVVSRCEDGVGICVSEPPLKILRVEKVAGRLCEHLSKVKTYHDKGNHEGWRQKTESFSKDLRVAWECGVESVVAPVLKWLCQSVNTKQMVKLTVISEQDCRELRSAYGLPSQLLHSQPVELNPAPPSPDDINKEIDALESWFKNIQKGKTLPSFDFMWFLMRRKQLPPTV